MPAVPDSRSRNASCRASGLQGENTRLVRTPPRRPGFVDATSQGVASLRDADQVSAENGGIWGEAYSRAGACAGAGGTCADAPARGLGRGPQLRARRGGVRATSRPTRASRRPTLMAMASGKHTGDARRTSTQAWSRRKRAYNWRRLPEATSAACRGWAAAPARGGRNPSSARRNLPAYDASAGHREGTPPRPPRGGGDDDAAPSTCVRVGESYNRQGKFPRSRQAKGGEDGVPEGDGVRPDRHGSRTGATTSWAGK